MTMPVVLSTGRFVVVALSILSIVPSWMKFAPQSPAVKSPMAESGLVIAKVL